MPIINGIFVVDFHECSHFVVYLLIKSHRDLIGVNIFYISSFPALTASDVEPISSSSNIANFPVWKFALISFTCTHR